ncbi:hypothetical protein ACH46F_32640 [Streptomyces virginiae]|uniref:hypothetical protein n=1 Tax=Streptomyces virginiae TaxID=1961 RepID=UPI00379825CB
MNATQAALRLRAYVETLPGQLIWSEDAYALLRAWGINRTSSATALRKSGMYPMRSRVRAGRTRWQLDKPFPWMPDRTPGRCPPPVRRKCRECGSSYVPPANMTPVSQWG